VTAGNNGVRRQVMRYEEPPQGIFSLVGPTHLNYLMARLTKKLSGAKGVFGKAVSAVCRLPGGFRTLAEPRPGAGGYRADLHRVRPLCHHLYQMSASVRRV
jgi:hypothetical protein